jgi:hypothetical protein
MVARTLWVVALLSFPAQAADRAESGSGPLQARTSIDLRVVIPEVMRLALLEQPADLRISAQDSALGEIRVTGARILLLANDPRGYALQARLSETFSEAAVEGLPAPMRIGPGGGTIPMPSMVGKPAPAPHPVEYRFRFPPGLAPGTYPWPLVLSIAHP